MTDSGLQRRFEFTRGARIWQFIRALLLTGAGAALVAFRASLTSNAAFQTILLYLGGFLAVTGIIALLVLMVLARNDKKQVVEVSDTGFTYTRGENASRTRTVKWSDVMTYELDTEAPIIDFSSWMDSTGSARGTDDFLGCLFTFGLGLYILMMQMFIGGLAWKVTFRLKGKKSLSFTAPGGQMNTLAEQVLPHYLPGKRKEPNSENKPDADSTPA